jgi:hypothetical protein
MCLLSYKIITVPSEGNPLPRISLQTSYHLKYSVINKVMKHHLISLVKNPSYCRILIGIHRKSCGNSHRIKAFFSLTLQVSFSFCGLEASNYRVLLRCKGSHMYCPQNTGSALRVIQFENKQLNLTLQQILLEVTEIDNGRVMIMGLLLKRIVKKSQATRLLFPHSYARL